MSLPIIAKQYLEFNNKFDIIAKIELYYIININQIFNWFNEMKIELKRKKYVINNYYYYYYYYLKGICA